MGMTIDETISELEILKKMTFSYMTANQAFSTAIDTMRKYQKIKEILDDWENNGEEDDPINIIDNIGEVVEDGNN